MVELQLELRGEDEIWLSGPCDPAAYARLCDPLVREGRVAHYVEVAADDAEELDRWYGLCFGRQQVYASQQLRPRDESSRGVAVRQGKLDDVFPLTHLVRAHLQGPPVWSDVEVQPDAERRRSWTEWFADARNAAFVAEPDGCVVAYLALEHVDERTIALGVAATLPEARGRGAMRALWAHAAARALERGYVRCETDWRSANVEADRCWRALGFRPTRYRLHRLVGR
jgi:ribosomal protein S18 acetylase RimI-like enzyme